MNYSCVSLITLLHKLMLSTIIAVEANNYYGYTGDDTVSLCDNPVIYAADRLVNNTVRLYRGNYYWELKGLSGTKGFVDGPHKIWYPGFKTVYPNASIVTILSGYRIGWLIRFEGRRFWSWDPRGYQTYGETSIRTHSIPETGFSAVFHNQNETHPMIIGFDTENVYYYTTKSDLLVSGLRSVGNRDGYTGGQFGENFPPGITSAFSYPSTDPENDGYSVYLFRNEKYCYRAAYMKHSTCDNWRPTRELFGCDYKQIDVNYLYLSIFSGVLNFFLHQLIPKRDFDDIVPTRAYFIVQSLCDDPVIYAADRLVNNTVRLYRGNYFWELKGLPGDNGFLDGPYELSYAGFNPVYDNTSLATILSGKRKGYLTKFEGRTWYAWNESGQQGWGDRGTNSHRIPKGGFSAVFHNGDDYDPMLIGFQSEKVYYYSTYTDIYRNNSLSNVGDIHGYIGGQYGENFPPDITAAFSYPSFNPETDGYYVYLFRNDKYCFRAAYGEQSSQSCDEWRLNRDLFGCDSSQSSKILQDVISESDEHLIFEKINGSYDIDDNDYYYQYNDYSACIAVRLSFISLFVCFFLNFCHCHS